ncbi:MAG: phosphoglucosamine mutase [Dehalococcoidia bacterium]|nr:phosphoglucosamine mutase [Dehalococcoidia bacterium]
MHTRRLFGTSGIRGVVNQDLSPDFCRRVALAIGTTLPPASTVCIATDTRISRDVIKEAVSSGLLSCGINVVDLGILPTPALALLTRESGFAAGIMVTASHNPPEFNGIKLFTENSLGYSQAQEAEIEKVYFEQKFRQGKRGTLEKAQDMKQRYLSFIKGKLSLPGFNHQLKIVVDPGNGAASKFASDIFVQMGLDIIPINDEPNGLFPGRSPEPKADTLQGTVNFLRQHNADLAICFDGDADRVVFCDKEGFLGFNEPIAFISRLVVKKTGKKKIATTVETGTLLDLAVKDLEVEVVRGRVGDVAVAHLAQELDAALGVEQVGVYIIPEAGYYPDSIFASLILLSQLSDAGEIRQYFHRIPRLFFEKAKVSCPGELKELVMAQVKEKAHLFAPDEIPIKIGTLDGLRLDFPNSWMLIRASGTEPVIRVISESTSQTQTDKLIRKGKKLVQSLVEANR